MKAKKSLGQHFLRSEKALATIIRAGDLGIKDVILEIGPGTGMLTRKLLDTGARVMAVEKDDGLVKLLGSQFEEEIKNGKLELIHDDILEFDFSKLAASSYKLVANIPYNITGAILKKFLETDNQPEKMVLLVQKEVAQRIIAKKKPLDSARDKESILSISVKAYGTPRHIETVRAGSFAPVPKVDSAIIAIDNISKKFFTDLSEKNFFNVVRTGFKSKRKKLSSNLSTMFARNNVREAFQKLNLDDNLRAEDVEIKIWRALAGYLEVGLPSGV